MHRTSLAESIHLSCECLFAISDSLNFSVSDRLTLRVYKRQLLDLTQHVCLSDRALMQCRNRVSALARMSAVKHDGACGSAARLFLDSAR
jgi:hypothetical protein